MVLDLAETQAPPGAERAVYMHRGDEQPGKASEGREKLRDSRGLEPGQGSCPMGASQKQGQQHSGQSRTEMLTPSSSNSTDRTHL